MSKLKVMRISKTLQKVESPRNKISSDGFSYDNVSQLAEIEVSYFDFRICIIGLTDAGFRLAKLFSTKYYTIGYDYDKDRLNSRKKELRIDLTYNQLANNQLAFTNNIENIRKSNFYVLGAKTSKELWREGEIVGRVISRGDFVVLSTPESTLERLNEFIPAIEKVSGLIYNEDFFAGKRSDIKFDSDTEQNSNEVSKIVGYVFLSVVS